MCEIDDLRYNAVAYYAKQFTGLIYGGGTKLDPSGDPVSFSNVFSLSPWLGRSRIHRLKIVEDVVLVELSLIVLQIIKDQLI